MKRIGIFAVLVLMAMVGMAGVYLTIHAGELEAASKGDSLFHNRYYTTSTTPISDLNALTGSSASGTSGQIRIHDGTDFESKSMSGDATIASTGVLTISASAVGSSEIIDNSVASADILNATVADADMAVNAITATKLFINTVTGTVADSETGTEVTVESGSVLIDTQLVSGFSNDVTLTKSILVGTTWIINTDAGAGQIVNGIFIRPSQ